MKTKKRPNATKVARGKADWNATVTIGGKKYDKAMISAAKYGARGDGVISMAHAKLILSAARPGGTNRATYDKVEKSTMAYIRKTFNFTGAADKLLRTNVAKLGAKQAKASVAKKKAAMEANKKLLKKPKKRPNATKVARGKADWNATMTIGGKKYDKAMISAAKYGARGDGVISMADTKLIILSAARPGGTSRATCDKVEKSTMAYIRKTFNFTGDADKLLRANVAKVCAKQAKATVAKKRAMK